MTGRENTVRSRGNAVPPMEHWDLVHRNHSQSREIPRHSIGGITPDRGFERFRTHMNMERETSAALFFVAAPVFTPLYLLFVAHSPANRVRNGPFLSPDNKTLAHARPPPPRCAPKLGLHVRNAVSVTCATIVHPTRCAPSFTPQSCRMVHWKGRKQPYSAGRRPEKQLQTQPRLVNLGRYPKTPSQAGGMPFPLPSIGT
jgi:hypothetical protein